MNNQIGDRNRSQDVNNSNDSKVILYLIAGFGFMCTTLISIAIVLAYISYYNINNEKLQPPNIEQIEFNMKD